MIQFFEIINENINASSNAAGFEVVRLMVVPVLSLITASMAISVFSATYFIVFRIRKYLKRHKNYLNFTNKLSTSIEGRKIGVFRPYETTMWGPKLDENKKLIGRVLSQYKNADLKDLILGTYNDELNSVKSIINMDNKLIKNNQKFVEFQRLFHVYREGEIILEYFNSNYISFYKVRKSGVSIGIISKEDLKDRDIQVSNEVDFSEIFSKKMQDIATIYQIYFIKRSFLYKNIMNPLPEFEVKLSQTRKIFNKIVKKKYSHYNVYIKEKFDTFPKLNKLLNKNDIYFIENDLLLESAVHKPVLIENVISEKIKKRKEIKEVINNKNKSETKKRK